MSVKIVTFNLRSVWCGDGINGFMHRAGMIYDKISSEKPDVIGFQEAIPHSIEFLIKLFPEYQFIGHGREEGYSGEGVYTAVRKDAFQVLGFETLWLSPTPYAVASRFEKQSPCPRMCNICQIRDIKTGERYYIFNTHLDHMEEYARVEGIKLVLSWVDERNKNLKLPTVIMGDFNASPESESIKICDAYDGISDVTSHIPVTFHDWGSVEWKIDYIYVSDDIKKKIKDVKIWDEVDNGIYLSDHYPICMEIE